MNDKHNPASSGASNVPMSDIELEAKVRKVHKRSMIGVAMIVLGVLGAILCIIPAFFIGVVAGFIVAVVGIIIRKKYADEVKRLISENLVRSALGSVFEDVQYDAFGHIPDSVVENTNMNFPFDFDEISGSDYVRATYQGLNVEMSDLTLVNVTTRVDSDGHIHHDRTTVFRGMWRICDFGKELAADLIISERTAIGKKLGLGGVKTENEAFNKQFHIESGDEHTVFYVLTPHMMEYIVQMDAKGAGDTYMHYTRQGKVHIAINSKRDSFEIGHGKPDVAALREKFLSEIRYVTDLIDELRLVDTNPTE